MLVGLKKDIRDNPEMLKNLQEKGEVPVTPEEGYEMAKRTACMAFIETSSYKLENVTQAHESKYDLSQNSNTV